MFINFRKIRVVSYDSVEVEAKHQSADKSGSTPATAFVRGLQAKAIEEFGEDPDQLYFNAGNLLTIETGVRISNLKPIKAQDE